MRTIIQAGLFEPTVKPDPKSPGCHGYATAPGGGPKGETCATCAFMIRIGKNRTYRKCSIVAFSHGKATDIKASAPACSMWSAKNSTTADQAGKGSK